MTTGSRRRRGGKPKGSAKARRTAARLNAVQALYQIEQGGADAAQVIGDFERHLIGKPVDGDEYVKADEALFLAIVSGCSERVAEVDEVLGEVLRSRPGGGEQSVDRLEVLIRAILRAATYELVAHTGEPARIVLADYIAVAHGFFGGHEPGLINGILDAVARRLRPDQLTARDSAAAHDHAAVHDNAVTLAETEAEGEDDAGT